MGIVVFKFGEFFRCIEDGDGNVYGIGNEGMPVLCRDYSGAGDKVQVLREFVLVRSADHFK